MSVIFRMMPLALVVTAWSVSDVAATEYQCRKADSSLRIAIEVKKAGHTLPCEVVAEDDRGERAVLYKARYDRTYCPGRIEQTRGELEEDGWACQKTSDQNVVWNEDGRSVVATQEAQTQETQTQETQTQETNEPADDGDAPVAGDDGEERVVTSSRFCRLEDKLRSIHIEVENSASGKPCELVFWEDGDQSKPGQLLWRAEHDASFCPRRLDTITGKWISEGWRCDSEKPETASIEKSPIAQARLTVSPDEDPSSEQAGISSDPTLEAMIAADADRIGEWMEVEPDIEIAARGDLNDDGSDDAVVFLAYQSDQAAYRQYLMSYLVGDDGYKLASVKLLTDVSPPPGQARVEQIDGGVIWLSLPERDGSTSEQTGYRLQNQQLVEVDATSPPNTGD